ncbi:MAG: LemA family protein [Coxiellaceae bacterium]|nr:LemA family protein [Coxiellaceae bacterium]
MIALIIIVVVIVLLILWVIGIYNALIRLKNQVQEGWSGIDVQLKRRHDLIPNLVSTVKGYKEHESSTLEEVTKLRANAMQASSVADKAKAESALSLGLGKLFAVAENYPDLKASANFLDLQKSLSEVEDNLQNARRYYNATARDFNTKVQSLPDNVIAGMFHFTSQPYFELDSKAEKAVPKVSF